MRRYTVLVTDYAWPSLDIEREILATVGAELLVAETGEEDELSRSRRKARRHPDQLEARSARSARRCARCLVVSRFGVGIDNIPVDRATELGILVTNVPDFCLEEVSDHAMALLLACARRVVPFASATRAGEWNLGSVEGSHD